MGRLLFWLLWRLGTAHADVMSSIGQESMIVWQPGHVTRDTGYSHAVTMKNRVCDNEFINTVEDISKQMSCSGLKAHVHVASRHRSIYTHLYEQLFSSHTK